MNGLLVIDKPGGMTSHDVVAQLRRATGESSIGHLGTLDPLATGVLPLLLGKYTRLARFFGPMTKSYSGVIRFGFATDTYDADGVAAGDPQDMAPGVEEVRAGAARFCGKMEQTPPPFSAKKIAGQPAYKAARKGQDVVLRPVCVTIESFEIGEVAGAYAEFTMRISSGGYVRSVAHDLGKALGCGAHLTRLRRTAAGPFCLDQALSLEEVCVETAAGRLEERLPHPRTLLPELPAVTVDPASAQRLRNGNMIHLPEFSAAPLAKVFASQRDLVAIVRRLAGTLFQPVVVLS